MLGRVVGTVVSTRKVQSIEGLKLLAVRQVGIDAKQKDGSYVVAVDAVQAGVGELVLYATGSAARQSEFTHNRPADAIIMAIVDTLEVDGELVYQKDN